MPGAVRGTHVRTVPVFDEHVAHVFGPTRPCLVLDVRRLHFCDSIGLSALIAARRRADLAGGRLILHGVHGMLERVLHITGAGALFTRARRRPGPGRSRRGRVGTRLTVQGRQALSTAATRSSGEMSTFSPRESRP